MTSLRTPSHTSTSAPSVLPGLAPPAARAQSPGWRDPRIVVGVLIVAACVLAGARVPGNADDTVAVWSVRTDAPRGTTLESADLVAVRVGLTGDLAERYLLASAAPAADLTLAHDLSAGELVPRGAVVAGSSTDLVEVPVSVAPDDVPASVRRGAVVDVWVTPKVPATGEARVRARLALDDVVVVEVAATGDSLAPRTTQQVIVGVDESSADDLDEALGEMAEGRVVLTRQAQP